MGLRMGILSNHTCRRAESQQNLHLMRTTLVLYAILAAAILSHVAAQTNVVKGTDAFAYVYFGYFFPSLKNLENVRTYGYPLLTWLYSQLGGEFNPWLYGLIGSGVQLGLYGTAVFWLASQFQGGAALAVMAGLLLNPVLVAFVSDILTEAPTLILTVLMMGCLIRISRSPRPLAWATAGALATNFALMIRPSNIVLIIAWNAALPLAFQTARTLVPYAGLWVATAAIAWAPQIAHNVSLGHYGVLPSYPLLAFQVKAGASLIHYATIIRDGQVAALVVPNFLYNDIHQGILWYINNPLAGMATLIMHVLAAFTFDRIFLTYVHGRETYHWLAGLMWAVIAIGTVQSLRLAYFKIRQPETIALALMFLMSIGLIAISAPENRFAAIPLAILSVSAAHFVATFQRKSRWFLVVAVVTGILGGHVSNALSTLRPTEKYTKTD